MTVIKMLRVLLKYHSEWPLDTRTLKKAGKRPKVNVESMNPGYYFYFGIEVLFEVRCTTRNH